MTISVFVSYFIRFFFPCVCFHKHTWKLCVEFQIFEMAHWFVAGTLSHTILHIYRSQKKAADITYIIDILASRSNRTVFVFIFVFYVWPAIFSGVNQHYVMSCVCEQPYLIGLCDIMCGIGTISFYAIFIIYHKNAINYRENEAKQVVGCIQCKFKSVFFSFLPLIILAIATL